MKARAASLILVVAAASLHAMAAPKHRDVFPPNLTVDEFIEQFYGKPNPSIPNSGTPYVIRYAQGYLAGVADLSEGLSWCAPSGLMPAEVDEFVVSELAKLVPALAKRPRGSLPPYAAPFLLEQYASKFPFTGSCTFTP